MITIEVNNSISRITGATVDQLDQLREVTSYLSNSAAAFFSGGRARRNYLINKRGEFSTGLLFKVEEEIIKIPEDYVLKENRVIPKPKRGMFDFKVPFKPYKAQHEAIYDASERLRGTISMPTGSGKSFTIALLIYERQLKTLIITPNLELKQQLSNTLKELFGSLDNITIENIQSQKLNTLCDYGMLIIDEAHHGASKTYRNLNKKAWNNIAFRYFFTATPFRSNDEEQMLLESIIGTPFYELTYQEALEAGMVCPIEAYYIDVPKTKVDGYTWPQVYNELVTNNERRNHIIAGILDALKQANKKTLCLVKEIKHGENLQELVVSSFANGQDEDTPDLIRLFNKPKSISLLIGTTGVLGEGVDTKLAEYVVIAGLGKSKNAFMQQVGRVMRVAPGKLSGKVILFRDSSHKWTLKHFNAQVKILKEEYRIKPIKLDLI